MSVSICASFSMPAGRSTFSMTKNCAFAEFLERCSKKKSFRDVLLRAFSSALSGPALDRKGSRYVSSGVSSTRNPG